MLFERPLGAKLPAAHVALVLDAQVACVTHMLFERPLGAKLPAAHVALEPTSHMAAIMVVRDGGAPIMVVRDVGAPIMVVRNPPDCNMYHGARLVLVALCPPCSLLHSLCARFPEFAALDWVRGPAAGLCPRGRFAAHNLAGCLLHKKHIYIGVLNLNFVQ
jgi:hypothetical protein